MTIRILGAIFIILGCGSVGTILTLRHRTEERTLRQLITLLDTMECELQYHLASLPELCRHAADNCSGVLKVIFHDLATELDKQVSPNASVCMKVVLSRTQDVPKLTYVALEFLGKSLGIFDMNGQVKELIAVRNECRRILDVHTINQHTRLRCYQTLSLCAGAAIAILLV